MFAATASTSSSASSSLAKTSSCVPLRAVSVAPASFEAPATSTSLRADGRALSVAGASSIRGARRGASGAVVVDPTVVARAADPTGAPAGQISAALMESMRAKIGEVCELVVLL